MSVETGLADTNIVRTTTDGYLSLTDLIREWTNTGKQNANLHIRNLVAKCLLPHRDKVHLGNGGTPSYVVTREEWDGIKHHISQHRAASDTGQADLYVLQYSTIWDCIKIGRSSDVQSRIRSLENGHNFRIVLLAVYPGKGHVERRVHQQLEAYQSNFGVGSEWFDLSADNALKVIHEVIRQSREEPPSFSESES